MSDTQRSTGRLFTNAIRVGIIERYFRLELRAAHREVAFEIPNIVVRREQTPSERIIPPHRRRIDVDFREASAAPWG
jgi:hypothetical protein